MSNPAGNHEYGVRILGVGSFYGVGFFSLFPLFTGHNISPGPECGRTTKFPSHCNKYGSLIRPSGECRTLNPTFIYFFF